MTCKYCNSITLDTNILVFSINICTRCLILNKQEYKYIGKTKAKTEYLLNDNDIVDLKFIVVPCKNSFHDAKLYLESQIKDKSIEKWTSLQNLEQEKTDRLVKRLKPKKVKRVNPLLTESIPDNNIIENEIKKLRQEFL